MTQRTRECGCGCWPVRQALEDFLSYFDPRGGISDVPLGPFERAAVALGVELPERPHVEKEPPAPDEEEEAQVRDSERVLCLIHGHVSDDGERCRYCGSPTRHRSDKEPRP